VLVSLSLEVRPYTTAVFDAWPVWCRTYGYLPSQSVTALYNRYQIVLLGDRGTQVYAACLRPLRKDTGPGLEPANRKSDALPSPPRHFRVGKHFHASSIFNISICEKAQVIDLNFCATAYENAALPRKIQNFLETKRDSTLTPGRVRCLVPRKWTDGVPRLALSICHISEHCDVCVDMRNKWFGLQYRPEANEIYVKCKIYGVILMPVLSASHSDYIHCALSIH